MPRTRLTDAQWSQVAPLLPGKSGDPGRTGVNNRRSLEAMLWIARTGAPWRDLPRSFGKWSTVYQRFRRWSQSGVFEHLFEATHGALDMTTVQVDGTFVKVHQHGTGALKAVARPRHPARLRPLAGLRAGSTRRSWPWWTTEASLLASS